MTLYAYDKIPLLNWKGLDLFIGGLYVGCVRKQVPDGWREWKMYKDPPLDTDNDNMKAHREYMIGYYSRMEATPWRGWLYHDEDGDSVGYWSTEEAAKYHTEKAALKLLQE